MAQAVLELGLKILDGALCFKEPGKDWAQFSAKELTEKYITTLVTSEHAVNRLQEEVKRLKRDVGERAISNRQLTCQDTARANEALGYRRQISDAKCVVDKLNNVIDQQALDIQQLQKSLANANSLNNGLRASLDES